MRLDGSSHQLAEMLALQTPPMSNTDREFLEGHANGSQFQDTPWVGDLYQGVAREAGVDTKGKVYLSGLARYQGDPEAWVTGRGDVQRVLEKRGWGAEGSVNVKPTQAKQLSKATHLADDLVDGEVSRVLQTVPESERPYVDVQDLRDQVVQTRKPHWSSSE
jgi:hypothetical protein